MNRVCVCGREGDREKGEQTYGDVSVAASGARFKFLP